MRRKISERAAVTQEQLPELTDQQLKFWHGKHSGKGVTEAYRLAYDCSNMSDAAVYVDASRLNNHPKIVLWDAAAAKAEIGKATRSKDQHILRLTKLQQIAIDTGNVGAAVQAEQLIGKVEGHYTERLDMHISGDPATTLAEIEAEFGAEIAQALARQTQH